MTTSDLGPVRRPSSAVAAGWVAGGAIATAATAIVWTALRDGVRLDAGSASWLAAVFAVVVLWRVGRRHWVYAVAALGGTCLTIMTFIGWFFWAWSRSPGW